MQFNNINIIIILVVILALCILMSGAEKYTTVGWYRPWWTRRWSGYNYPYYYGYGYRPYRWLYPRRWWRTWW